MESAVGVAGLAFALPGVIDLLVKYGQWIWDRIQTFKDAKGVWKKLGQFGYSLTQGEFHDMLMAANSFYSEEGCDPGMKISLKLHILKLKAYTELTKTFMENQDPEHPGGRFWFSISGERRAKELNKALQNDKQNLTELLTINDIKTRRVPSQLLLTTKRFARYESAEYEVVPSTNNLFVTSGDYRDDPFEGPYQETTVILERSNNNVPMLEEELKEIAGFLHYRLRSPNTLSKGILPCLGYRMSPAPELIFSLPKETENPTMLQSIIAKDNGVPSIALDDRFRLARRLCEAVLRVHAAGLVHKNIRPNTIMILQPVEKADEAPKLFDDVYLTNWRLLREVSGPTMKSGGIQWTEDIYRHPGRQGDHIQERYNVGHDIYSLGACLLEIGLWDVLVKISPDNDQPQVSELFRSAAKVDDQSDPEAALRAKISRPTDVKNILLELAQEKLPQKMGRGYSRLVVACLKGLDNPSGFGDNVNLVKMNKVEQGVVFEELVLSYFTDALT
ncbi:hypothetical protein BKA66DRAFT_466359 [Pyrenochaeta sp. MPI-SDFR-AT-0127]|nr:hypothetical protein BKA66DRAFT_466359 [Pyrenochaeta sp. MPI-SDFR-AT-0127]